MIPPPLQRLDDHTRAAEPMSRLPQSSQTLAYLLMIAMLSQVLGEAIMPAEMPENIDESHQISPDDGIIPLGGFELAEHEVNEEEKNQGFDTLGERQRTHDDPKAHNTSPSSFRVSLGSFLSWAPPSLDAFVPKLFRASSSGEEALVVQEIGDDALIRSALNAKEDAERGSHSSVSDQGERLASSAQSQAETQGDGPNVAQDEAQSEAQSKTRSETQGETQKRHIAKSTKQSVRVERTTQRDTEKRAQVSKVKAHPKRNSATDASSSTHNSTTNATLTPSPKTPSAKPEKVTHPKPKRRLDRNGIPLYSIEDPKRALIPFYRKLNEARSGARKVHIVHYGDSLIAGDLVTQTARQLLQKTFGDGGHGFFLAGKGSKWYRRNGVKLRTRGRWKKLRFTRPKELRDRMFGLGGVTFSSASTGAWVQAKPDGRAGRYVDRFELVYLAHPRGGSLEVSFAGESQVIDTHAETKVTRRLVMRAPASGAHKARVKVKGGGTVRLFGFVFERNRGGIVYDALGLEGARVKQLLSIDLSSWSQQLRQRKPDLYILHYGTNESGWFRAGPYRSGLESVLARFRKILPNTPCMLMSPMDRARKSKETGRVRSMKEVAQIVKIQREVSLSRGCAFWSAYDAMGGRGSMKRWYRASPKLAGGDLTHPTVRGARRLGSMFYNALMEGYRSSRGSR